MKFKTSINELKKTLSLLYPIINHNHSTLGMRYILVRQNGENTIEFKVFNDSIIGSSFIKGYDFELSEEEKNNILGENEYYVLGKHFIGLVNSFNASEIVISLDNDKCSIKCGKSNYKLKMLDDKIADEQLSGIDINYYNTKLVNQLEVKASNFIEAYNSVSHCMTKDNSRINLQSVAIYKNKMIACNDVLASVVPFDSGEVSLFLAKKACECILNMDKNDFVKIYFDNKQAIVSNNNFICITNVVDNYPIQKIEEKINDFNPKDFKIHIVIEPDEIVDKLNRILMFTDNETNALDIIINKDNCVLTVENVSYAQETINLFENINNNDMSIFIDGKSLKESLQKTLSKTHWYSNGGEEMQYIHDGYLLQFFFGLEK